jgi:hypothetical protein
VTHTFQDHDVYQGQTWVNTVTIYESETSATPDNIIGWALEATFAPTNTGTTDSDLTKTVGSGITITDGVNGVCTITLTAANTLEMDGEYEWALWVIDSGAEAPLSLGTLSMKETARSRSTTT